MLAPSQTRATARHNRHSKVTVALLGPYGYGNLGDAAIQDAVIAQLRVRRPDVQIVGVSMRPADTLSRHGIPTFAYDLAAYQRLCARGKHGNRPAGQRSLALFLSSRVPTMVRHYERVRRLLNEFRHCLYIFRRLGHIDVLLMSGGGQLDEVWGGPMGHPLSLFKWSLLARLRGTPVAYLSVGVGSAEQQRSRKLLRLALQYATYRSYRDEGSRVLARSLFGLHFNDQVVPDMAFALPVGTRPKPCPEGQSDPMPLTIAVGPLPYRHPTIWPDKNEACYNRYVHLISSACVAQLRRGRRIRFIVGESAQDPVVIRDIANIIDSTPEINRELLETPRIRSVAQLLIQLQTADIVISSRFHGVLLSLLLHKPVLALSYERKVRQLMLDFNQGHFSLDLEDLDQESITLRLERLILNRPQVELSLSEQVPNMTQRVLEQFDMLIANLLPQPNA